MNIHVVESGETLWKIAQKYGSDSRQIALLNEMDDPDVLVVGQSLVIPEPDRDYVVQPGDTLSTIAQKLGYTVQQLAEANQIADPAIIYSGQMIQIPLYKPVIDVSSYITNLSMSGKSDVLYLGRYLTYIYPFTHRITDDGSVTELNDQAVLEAARETNTAPLLVITNFAEGSFDSDAAAKLLRNTDIQEQLIKDVLEKMNNKGYMGVNIDFEYVYPEDRENYNAFVERLVNHLHPEGYIVSTSLAPKKSRDQEGLLYEAHDYEAHGRIADFVILMTYEWGWAGGRPRAIAPLNEVKGVLDYAISVMPRNKIVMGMPTYGRDWDIPWEEGTRAGTISPQRAVQLAAEQNASIQYDEESQSPFFRYTDDSGQRHEVWFEDARSVQAKYETVKNYRLRGVSFWVLGIPFPQNWPVLQNNFKIRQS